ncbi:predicted protein [Histoplasma capsulatum var. duboisii H88]|uniref:Predicted protein n=2 Tax=Ajellomyces capsulatus TaxID=5037 RepID=F0UNJ3_AJEC8|nr:predicted protein [Histoplasma capsulatum H143]EGC46808.1 predicted protein [Histoplasma capsulatum var. duboisii H88]
MSAKQADPPSNDQGRTAAISPPFPLSAVMDSLNQRQKNINDMPLEILLNIFKHIDDEEDMINILEINKSFNSAGPIAFFRNVNIKKEYHRITQVALHKYSSLIRDLRIYDMNCKSSDMNKNLNHILLENFLHDATGLEQINLEIGLSIEQYGKSPYKAISISYFEDGLKIDFPAIPTLESLCLAWHLRSLRS